MNDYDVIIAGASFAGLAVANQLKGHRVLLIDRYPVGTKQTSACGTILRTMEYWELMDTVLQTHNRIMLHTSKNSIELPSPYPWCTFDYSQLCETLLERSGADFLQAAVLGIDDDTLRTNRGDYKTDCIVDATGWRAVLASSIDREYVKNTQLNFGIETIGPIPKKGQVDPAALHFWYDPAILHRGVGWYFPRGETVSVGVGSFLGATHLRKTLAQFAGKHEIHPNGIHGTYFPNKLRNPTIGRVFVVGDAAGMCIGLTSEGIRPAMFFGEICGKIVRRVIEGDLTLDDGLLIYDDFVNSRKIFFQIFTAVQDFLTRLPPPWIDPIAHAIQTDLVLSWILTKYRLLTREWDKPG